MENVNGDLERWDEVGGWLGEAIVFLWADGVGMERAIYIVDLMRLRKEPWKEKCGIRILSILELLIISHSKRFFYQYPFICSRLPRQHFCLHRPAFPSHFLTIAEFVRADLNRDRMSALQQSL